jgi:hypothetical protein
MRRGMTARRSVRFSTCGTTSQCDALRCLGDVAFRQECLERHQKIQIDGSQIHGSALTIIHMTNNASKQIHLTDFVGSANTYGSN